MSCCSSAICPNVITGKSARLYHIPDAEQAEHPRRCSYPPASELPWLSTSSPRATCPARPTSTGLPFDHTRSEARRVFLVEGRLGRHRDFEKDGLFGSNQQERLGRRRWGKDLRYDTPGGYLCSRVWCRSTRWIAERACSSEASRSSTKG